MGDTDQLMSLEQAAAFLGRPIETLRRWRRTRYREFPSFAIGRRVFVRRSALEAWIAGWEQDELEAVR